MDEGTAMARFAYYDISTAEDEEAYNPIQSDYLVATEYQRLILTEEFAYYPIE